MSNSEHPQTTRQQIYDRIRQSSKAEYILDEMIRLGFWQQGKDTPTLPEELIREEGELTRELQELFAKQRQFQDRQKMLHELRKKRLEESKQKQAETKARKQQEREDRIKQWQEQKTRDITYLGEQVSGGLHQTNALPERLQQQQLPMFTSVKEMATAMNVSVGELRFLTFHRTISTISHYKRFYMLKKMGGMRLISAPMPRIKRLQRWVLDNILSHIPIHPVVQGFRPEHSIVSNARPHCGQEIVINMDLKDFFPSITYPRTKGMFHAAGYSEQCATILALLCTTPDIDEVVLDGQTYYVAVSERQLPQGAPTSPAITNVICRRLDSRLAGMAAKLNFRYTRYADDMTFSCGDAGMPHLSTILWQTQQIIDAEGFRLHPDKLRVMRKGSRQEVTGIVVNEKPNLNRTTLRRFRALLFQIEHDGFDGKFWNGYEVSPAFLRGFVNYILMVNPQKGQPLRARVERVLHTAVEHKESLL